MAITPTHFKVERMQKKNKTKKSDVSKSVSKSDVSAKDSKSDNSESPLPKGDAPEKKKEVASDKSALRVTKKVTGKTVKGPLFRMTKIVKGAFVEEIAPEKILEIRALAESIVETKKDMNKKSIQILLDKSDFEKLLQTIESASAVTLPALLKQAASELQRHKPVAGGIPNKHCTVCRIPPNSGDTLLPCTRRVLSSLLKVLHTNEEGVLRAALKVAYQLLNKKLTEEDSLCIVKNVYSSWMKISNEIHAETAAALKLFFTQAAGRFPYAFGNMTWALIETIREKQTNEKSTEFKMFLYDVINKHLKSENADAWFKLADHIGSREARPPKVIVNDNNGMILPLNDSQRNEDDDPESVAFWNNNGL